MYFVKINNINYCSAPNLKFGKGNKVKIVPKNNVYKCFKNRKIKVIIT